jgi:hypothetical protein
MLKPTLKNQGVRTWTEFSPFRIRAARDCYEHGTEPLDFIKCGTFLDQLSDY